MYGQSIDGIGPPFPLDVSQRSVFFLINHSLFKISRLIRLFFQWCDNKVFSITRKSERETEIFDRILLKSKKLWNKFSNYF